MFDYEPARLQVIETVNAYSRGRELTLTKSVASGPEYAPSKANTPTAMKYVEFDGTQAQAKIFGGLAASLSASTKIFLVSTEAGVAPAEKDKVRAGGVDYEVSRVSTLSPGGVDLLYGIWVE